MPTGFEMNSFSDPESLIDDVAWDLLSAYVDGETSPEEAHRVEDRLKSDPHYLGAYNMLRATSAVANGIGDIEPPATLRAGILAATTQRRTSTLATMARYALAVGTVAAAAAIVGMLFIPGGRSHVGYVHGPDVAMNTPQAQPADPVDRPVDRRQASTPHLKTSLPAPSHDSRDAGTEPQRDSSADRPILLTDASVKVASTPRLSSHLSHDVGLTARHADRGVKPLFRTETPASGTIQQVADNYTPRPMMGTADFRPAATQIASDVHSDDQPIRTADEDVSHPEVITVSSTQLTDNQAPRVRFAKLLKSQLASDSPALLTGAEIKHIRDTSMYGFDRANTENLPHRDSAALVVGRF